MEIVADSNIVFSADLCRDIDEKNTPFLALSIELNMSLWINDKILLDGLRAKR